MRSSKRVCTQRRPVTTTSRCRRKGASQASAQCLRHWLTCSLSRQVTIGKLPGEVLLNIFLHCLDVSPQFWPTLVHVCQNWRQIVFTSPLTLHLRLYCKNGTPVSKTLGCWPVLPIIVQYGGSPALDPPSPEDEDNVVAALKQSDRVSSISLTITSSLLAKFFSIEEPFSDLQDLVLLSQNSTGLVLPSTFKWGSRLRRLQSTGISLPSLPRLLSSSPSLVDLQLHEVPGVGYFSPGEFASALSGMTQLQSLSLHFLSPASRPRHIELSPSPGERVVLPALTHLKFRGTSEYLNSLVTRIDAPGLVDIEVRFFNQLIFHLTQLRRFIDQIEIQKLHRRADIEFSGHAVSITFSQPESHARLTLQISCEHLDWQLSSMAQICDNLSPFLSSVQDLGIGTTQRPSGMGDVDGEQWLELIRAFDGAEDFRVASELTTDILHALRPVDGEYTTVFPALRNLRISGLVSVHGPLREAVESFTTSRRFSGHPVQVYPPSPVLSSHPVQVYSPSPVLSADKKTPDIPHSTATSVMSARQGLNRHDKDKAPLEILLPYGGFFFFLFFFFFPRPISVRLGAQSHALHFV
ncbi:hypothetical protein EDB84DRAFT_57913 [Lactarius hengduanensis]|nr:hypothetical protein EDB84DRAFT_57913 [Lactarius hengduanensis]